MRNSMNRRRMVALGAAGAVGAAWPLVRPDGAAASPVEAEASPGRVFDVTRFGAKGDGTTIDSDAINRAIAAAARQGGTVYFPAGTYASYSIHLASNVHLYLGQGATILAAAPAGGRGYDPAEPGAGNPYQDFGHSHWRASLIWGENLENIGIGGPACVGSAVATNPRESGGPG